VDHATQNIIISILKLFIQQIMSESNSHKFSTETRCTTSDTSLFFTKYAKCNIYFPMLLWLHAVQTSGPWATFAWIISIPNHSPMPVDCNDMSMVSA